MTCFYSSLGRVIHAYRAKNHRVAIHLTSGRVAIHLTSGVNRNSVELNGVSIHPKKS